MRRFAFIFLSIWALLRWVLEWGGNVQTVQSFFEHKGDAVRIGGAILMSQWTPLMVLGLLVVGYLISEFGAPWHLKEERAAQKSVYHKTVSLVGSNEVSLPLSAFYRAGGFDLSRHGIVAVVTKLRRNKADPFPGFPKKDWVKFIKKALDIGRSINTDEEGLHALSEWIETHTLRAPWDVSDPPDDLPVFDLVFKETGDESTHSAAKFETFEPRINYQEAIRKFELSIGFRNRGEVDATDVDCSLWMSDCFFARHSQIRAHQSSQDVPPAAHRFFNLTFGITKPRIDPHFVVFTISYRSGEEPEPREQKFYYRWYGIKNDVTRDTLEIASRDERAKIDRRIQDEISGVPLKPIEIRNSLDRLIEDAGEILAQWKRSQDAIATDNMQDMALSWIRGAEDFIKRNLEVRHVDQLRDYGMTLTPGERYKITFDLESSGLAWQRFPVAHELASKSQVLSHFHREIV